jgi:ligand-binding sensor domain-containing protein
LLSLLLCLSILTGALPTASPVAVQAQEQPPAPLADELVVQAAAGMSALDVAPAEADAIVSDPRNPAWQTRYGSLAGKLSLAPRYATFAAALAGPEVSIGDWQSHTLQAGAGNISALAALPDGRLYAGIEGGGLWVYAPAANGVYAWINIPAGPNGPASDAVTALAVFQGRLWVGTANAGISVLNPATNGWSTFNTGNGLPSNSINRLTPVKATELLGSDYLWAGTSGGAALYSRPLLGSYGWSTVTTGNGLASNEVLDVTVWRDQNTTYTFFATDNGLNRRTGNTMTQINGGGACLFDRAKRVVVDHNNRLWLAVEENVPAVAAASIEAVDAPAAGVWVPLGVCRFTSGLGGGWQKFDAATPGLPSNLVTDLSVDEAGRVWMSFFPTGGSSSGGVASYDQGAWLIFRPADAPIGDGRLNRVLTVGEAVWLGRFGARIVHAYSPNWVDYTPQELGNPTGKPGPLLVEAERTWAGSFAGITRYEAGEWRYREIPNNSSTLTAIVRGVDNLLYIATEGGGLFTYDGANAFTRQTVADGLPSNDLRALLIDQDGRLWVGTGAGLALRGVNYWLVFTTANSGLASDDITSLTLDGAGNIWIGTAANGISVFDPTANGADAWSTQTAANGLPANAINALSNDPSGAIWAATTNGLARWNPADGQWTVYTTANGLPGNNILSIAIDPAGIVWAGTDQGLARLETNGARVFHVTGSFLHSDRVIHLAADDKLMWASAGERVAVRGILDGPIGDFPPVITSIAPLEGAPLDKITITGDHFDDRGPQYNEVRFCCFNGQSGIAAPLAKVISVTVTSMVVEVPLLAKSGKITVKAHNLTVESTQEFQIVPVITNLSAGCVGPGALLEIHGRGFFGVGGAAAYVTIGNGPERLADVQDPTLIRQYIRPGDTTGVVKVRLLNNKSATSSSSVTVAMPFVTATAIQQGIQGEQMVWGKRTLVQLFLRTTYPDYCNVVIDGGQLDWKKKGGATEIASRALFPAAGGLQVPNAPPAIGMDTGINFVAEFNTIRSSYYTRYFPLAQFDGVKITLKRGIIEVMTIDIPASQFNFVEISDLRHFLNVPITPKIWTKAAQATFWENARKGIEATARAYPQPDVEGLDFGKRQWMWNYHWTPVKVDYAWLGDPDDEDDGELSENFGDMQDKVDDIREDLNDRRCDGGNAANDDCHPWLDQAMGIVDTILDMGGYGGKATVTCYNPFGDCDRNSAISFNKENRLAPIYLQEAIHATSWVETGAPNHDKDNKHHSRYDEGEWKEAVNCMITLNFRWALMDQTGSVKRVIRLDANNPFQFPMPLTAPGACEIDKTPKSAMSYAPGQRDRNTFLEPVDYRHTLNYIRNNGVQAAQAAPLNVDQTLRINGKIDQTNNVTVTMSSILGTEGAVLSTPGGDYHLLLLGENGQVLHDHAFTLAMEHTHTDANDQVKSRFNLRVPFPAGVKTVAIQHDGMVLWVRQVSANAPTANFVAPNGGSFNAANVMPVSWQAADADGDALQFALDYTPDNGDSWFLLVNKLTGNSYEWTPGFVPASSQGRLRLRVSDGFNTAETLSAPFELTAQAPFAFIYTPEEGKVVTEGTLVDFEGGSLTGDGFDAGGFEWSRNGVVLSSQRGMSLTLEETGTHLFDLKVTANGLSATKSVSVTVVADYDRDGLPNDWEQTYKFNPIDPADALNDPDNDGLSNLEEYKRGTNPLVADTDGDGMNDGDELNASRDPLVADTSPTGPVLQVGAVQVGFTSYYAGFTPTPQSFWVTNSGPGDLNWSATADVSWLQLSVSSGAAPTEVSVSANSSGLEPGDYTGHITFTAPGAANSPQVVTATLKVRGESSVSLMQLYLPLVQK